MHGESGSTAAMAEASESYQGCYHGACLGMSGQRRLLPNCSIDMQSIKVFLMDTDSTMESKCVGFEIPS